VVAVGRGLEPWLDGVRQQAGGLAKVVTLTDGLPERTTTSGAPDPFAWLDVANAKQMVATLAAALVATDPVDQAAFTFAADAYSAELDRVDQEVRRVLGPVSGRGLVTAKETFGWFAARYGLEVVGAVVPSPNGLVNPPAQHFAALLQTLQAKQVKAVFAEASVPDGSVRTLARDAGVKAVVGTGALLGDGLGPAGTQTDTFLGALRHNARTMADNLA
jgi:ABC-type Zn uptake system ZnuABC Zn-binding protein ZnuA